MSVRDREVVELLRDEPELLAIADAVSETERLPRRSLRRRRTVAAVVAAAVALFAFALLSPWDSRNERGLVLERARAAIETRGPVLHIAFRYTSDRALVDLATGKTTPLKTIEDRWYDPERQVARVRIRRGGKVVVDETGSGDDVASEAAYVSTLVAEAARYRDALAAGKAEVVGEGTWRGHPVYWVKPLTLESGAFGSGALLGIDRETYRIVVVRYPKGTTPELLDVEYVARSEARFGEISPRFGERGGSVGGGLAPANSLTPAKVRMVLGVPAAWAGPSLDGLPLNAIQLGYAQIEPPVPGGKSRELTLVYGGRVIEFPGAPPEAPKMISGGIRIIELPANQRAWEAVADAKPPPAGFADLDNQDISEGAEELGLVATWTALLSVGDVWVRVGAPTRELAIATARALRPIPADAR